MFFVQMAGFPGSGKSTLARELAKNTGAIIIDHDIVKSALMETPEANTIDTINAGIISYNIEWALIDFHLFQGETSVILDSPCFYVEGLEKGLNISKKHNVKYKYIECFLDDINEINDRLSKRKNKISQIQKVKSEEVFKSAIQNSKHPSDSKYLVIDTRQPLQSYIQEAIDYINE
ncbi:AAA family ATPase [Pseudalkalibacillus berkeleyi]|uniref:ATP-binding protein n=1 Tax=Pseudalkalibacillus berkeleyi TaxID=1069813 RepID=A0ABS9GYA5_9BACL|nr:AAA family ATPase [Pseudalkalibacillus berkeleyi]MCF6137747.1 ATP-binding protein [Pseudalkalibacillus berkeleyi]